VLTDIESKTALVIDIVEPLTHNLPETEKKKIRKYANLALEIKKIY
jgi:ribosomal protein L30E